MEREDPKSIEYIDGIAIHYYGNFFPASILSNLHNRYPDKMLLSTEACEGINRLTIRHRCNIPLIKNYLKLFTGPMPWDEHKVELGSWNRARNYVRSILQVSYDLRTKSNFSFTLFFFIFSSLSFSLLL